LDHYYRKQISRARSIQAEAELTGGGDGNSAAISVGVPKPQTERRKLIPDGLSIDRCDLNG